MLELGVKMLIAYLLGTLLGSLILGRLRGVDIRAMGSGNAGATNALRTQGKLFGLLVLRDRHRQGRVCGLVAAHCGAAAASASIRDVPREWLTLACGFAVIVGHVYPVWFDFRGGKGAATVVGVVAALDLRLLVPLLLALVRRAGADRLCGSRHHAVGSRPHARPCWCSSRTIFRCCAFAPRWRRSSSSPIAATSRACARAREHRVRRLWLFRSRAA